MVEASAGSVAAIRSIAYTDYTLYDWQLKPVYINLPFDYPIGYEGITAPYTPVDADDDELTKEQEQFQGTSDALDDTDSDGISDLKESIWFEDRDDVFCDKTTTPYTCSYPNPIEKDLYVEIDWMKDSSNRTYKPSSTQLDIVEDMYSAKGVNLHVDIGDFGGGEELVVASATLKQEFTPGQIDFWDYKSGGDMVTGITSKFSGDRYGIWRYMITGNAWPEEMGSTGWAEAMGDDLFISIGVLEDASGLANEDRAIAGTIAHELGHNLCLSPDRVYVEQSTDCVYAGIDNNDIYDSAFNLLNYESVMNYRYQLTNVDDLGIVDYSDGSHGTGDHDDWSAALSHIGKFSGTKTVLGAKLAVANSISPDGDVIIKDEPITGKTPSGSDIQETPASSEPTEKSSDETDLARKSSDNSTKEQNSQEAMNFLDSPYLILGGVIVALIVAAGIVYSKYLKH